MSSKQGKFKERLKDTKTPSFEFIMNAKGRCDIPSNVNKVQCQPINSRELMANDIRTYVKYCSLCCCEGPSSIFCIKYCKEKSLSCCQLCQVDEEEFDNYSEYESDSESLADSDQYCSSKGSDGDTSIGSKSD